MVTSTVVSSGSTTTGPYETTIHMTARFTPPSSCSSSWTFEPSGANGIPDGLLIQNAAASDNVNPSCWPSGYEHFGRETQTQIFSPGYCPVGYTSADVGIAEPVTTAACCLSGYTYNGDFLNGNAKTYAGCTKMFPSGNSTIVTVRQDPSSSTQVTGPVTMWAQPIMIALESSDSSLFVSATTTTDASSSTQTQTTDGTHSTTGTTSSTTTSSPDTASSSSSDGLSTGAKIGIGIGVGLGGLGIIALIAAICLFRRRKGSTRNTKPVELMAGPQQILCEAPSSNDNSNSQLGQATGQNSQYMDFYAAEQSRIKDRRAQEGLPPAELGGMPPAELDGTR